MWFDHTTSLCLLGCSSLGEYINKWISMCRYSGDLLMTRSIMMLIDLYVRLKARQRDIMAYNHELIASVTSY